MSLDYTIRDKLIEQERQRGTADALDLRERAPELDGTGVIAEERKIPVFVPDKDYSSWPAGSPVRELIDEEYQVYKWITPVNTAHYPGFLPSQSPALCSLCHTTDPLKAKPYVAPNGTSGLYMYNECCIKNGHVWRSIVDDNSFPPDEIGTEEFWEDLGEIYEVYTKIYGFI